MKITEKRIKEIIHEEISLATSNSAIKTESARNQLQRIALQAAMLHDGIVENIEMSSWAIDAKEVSFCIFAICSVYKKST